MPGEVVMNDQKSLKMKMPFLVLLAVRNINFDIYVRGEIDWFEYQKILSRSRDNQQIVEYAQEFLVVNSEFFKKLNLNLNHYTSAVTHWRQPMIHRALIVLQ